ncbi:tape measure protein [Dyella sp. 20L07]|uniref:tape measure protein n=1 Tax=Dyella sp. 20L07 TaxID=3384240 RepID=UPI003D27655E
MTDYVLGIRLTGDGRTAVQAFDSTTAAARNMGSGVASASEQANRALNGTESATSQLDSSLSRTVSTVTRWGAALYGLHQIRELTGDIVESSSKVAGWSFGLQAATGSASAAADQLQFVRSESDRLGISLDSSASVFTRLTAATKGTSLQGIQTREIFTSVADAARALHLSSQETGQALLALDQMMSKGTVQSQELKLQLGNVLPGAVHVFAEALGVTTQQLDKMMDNGQVLAEDALPKLAKRLDEIYGKAAGEAAKAPAAELQRLKNATLELEAAIGNAGFMGALAGGARELTESVTSLVHSGALEHLVTGVEAIAALGAANVLGGYAAKLSEAATGLVAKGQATRQAIIAEQAAAASALELARATSVDTAAEVENAQARLASIELRLRENVAVQSAAAAEVAAATEITAAMRGQVAAATAIVEANAARAAGWTEASGTMAAALAVDSASLAQAEVALNTYTAAEARALEAMIRRDAALETNVALARQQILVEAELAAVKTAAANAGTAVVAAEGRLASAMTQGGMAMQMLSKAGNTVLSILGGWPGVMLLAGAGLVYLALRQTEAEKAAGELSSTTERLANAHGMVTDAAIKAAQAQIEEQRATLSAAKAHLVAAQAQQAYVAGAQHMDTVAVRAAEAARGIEELQGSIQRLGDQIQRSIIEKAFQDNLDFLAAGARQDASNFDQLRDSIKKQTATLNEQVATFGKGKAAQAEYALSIAVAAEQAKGDNNVTKQRIATLQGLYAPQIEAAKQLDALTAAQKANTQAQKDAKKDAQEEEKRINDIAGAWAKLADIEDTLSGKSANPLNKAWAESAKSIRDVAEAGAILIKNGVDEATVQHAIAKAVDGATDARNRAIAAAQREMDVAGQMIQQMQEEARISLLSERDQAIARAGMEAEQKIREKNLGLSEDQIASERRRVEVVAASTYDLQKAAEQQRQQIQETNGYLENGLNSFSRAWGDMLMGRTHDWKDFTGNLKSIFQQTVSDLIAQWARLQVFGPMLSQVLGGLGGGGGLLGFAANYYGSGGTITNSAGSLGGDGSAAGGNSYSSYLQSGVQAYKTYNYLTNGGLSALFGSAGSGVTGTLGGGYGTAATVAQGNLASYGVTPSIYSNIGNFAGGVPAYSPLGGSFSVGGYSAPWASAGGALLGALYGSRQGGGGFSTVASTASYGALGAGIAGTAAGVAGGASLGTAATGAFGAAAASTSWIPIVGWIMAGLAALDHFSDGKVFGTGWKPAQSNVNLNLGPNGASADANELLWKYKGQTGLSLGGFLTGGLSQLAWWGDKKTKTKQLDVTPEMIKAAQALYDNVEKVLVNGAQKLGTDVPSMIEATLTAQTTYDKKGKVKGTEYLVQYMGQTWKEATADAAAQRIGAEALVSVLNKVTNGAAEQIAQRFADTAEHLQDAANAMLAAQQDIQKGNSLLALGSSATLAEVIQFTQGLQQSGETLADAYTRLQQANASYLQFVGQFQQTGAGLGSSLQAIYQQMTSNIDQANALAQAAGLAGAREEDLANIHKYAAQQAADALAQLSAAAQDLATKLYSATGTTLAAVQAQIDQVQSKLQSATQTALSDLSPLSTKEKLDVALKGLRSGITSASDVLQIGRQLYASGADYNALYAKVMEISGQPATSGDLSSQLGSYNDLISQRDQLQAQATATGRFTDAKTLAQYIADISTAHGISYNEAASGLGFKLSDLAKDLGLTNINGYLDSLQQQDIAGTTLNASNAIVDAIRNLGRDLIQTIVGGPLVNPGPATPTKVTTSDPAQLAKLQDIDEQLDQLNKSIAKIVTNTGKSASAASSSALRATTTSTRVTA